MFAFRYVKLSLLFFLLNCSHSPALCSSNLTECEHKNNSPLFKYSTDTRLIMGVKKVGELKNGMAVHTWFWNKEARKLGLNYNDPLFGALNDRSSLSAVGLLTDEIKKFHPQAIFIGPDGYEHIDEEVLKEKDSFLRGLIDADGKEKSNSCTKIIDTKYTLCF